MATGKSKVNYLVVDLDGTLIYSDILYESILQLIISKPIYFFALPFWLLMGKAFLKMKLAKHVRIDVTNLPFNFELINWLKAQKLNERKLILCTATYSSVADQIASHVGIFDDVLSSNGEVNLSGRDKANLLVQKYGEFKFDYVGNSYVDLRVWEKSACGIVVNASKNVLAKARLVTNVMYVFPKRDSYTSYVKIFRLHQWVKNILIFVPIFAAHQTISDQMATELFLGFLSFGLCASSVYIGNDMLDLQNDRKHPRKYLRSFASGYVPLSTGFLFVPILMFSSFLIAFYLNKTFLLLLLGYFSLSSIYSFSLKRIVLVDCLILAILYTLRIVAGAILVSLSPSFWLLAFSVFFFLSLAFVKRFAELKIYLNNGNSKNLPGRGYFLDDTFLIQQMGVTSGYLSALVLALYINSENVINLYPAKEVIWCAVPLILLWISWIWLKANRGEMHDDPIVFAFKDKLSFFIGILFVAIFILASIL